MWDTIKNICAIVVVAYLIASNPQALVKTTQWVTKIVYNTSVIIIKVVEGASEQAKEVSKDEFLKEVPDKKASPKEKKLSYEEWMRVKTKELESANPLMPTTR